MVCLKDSSLEQKIEMVASIVKNAGHHPVLEKSFLTCNCGYKVYVGPGVLKNSLKIKGSIKKCKGVR